MYWSIKGEISVCIFEIWDRRTKTKIRPRCGSNNILSEDSAALPCDCSPILALGWSDQTSLLCWNGMTMKSGG